MKCRFCDEFLLNKPLVSLRNMPLTDKFIPIDQTGHKEYLQDINIYECLNCGLVQNPIDYDHEDYYKDYQYSVGQSVFSKNFMRLFAEELIKQYEHINKRKPRSVIEIGSGDGVQLLQFQNLGISRILGIEPSEYLSRLAIDLGVPTLTELFGKDIKSQVPERFDICLSSYTFDHIRNPSEYLQMAYTMLNDGGIIAFEIHNLEKIIERTEYCLFEHEHTIYMTPADAKRFIEAQGFEVLAIDPIATEQVRGNSLIVVAKKSTISHIERKFTKTNNPQFENLNDRIIKTIELLDSWVYAIPKNEKIIGFGAGGRGVMTLAAMSSANRFSAIFDSNFSTNHFVTPKTNIPVVGMDCWDLYSDSYCLIFSYGYYSEISTQLINKGFSLEKIISLADFFPKIK